MKKNRLVAGIDSSTQACKVMIHDAQTGTLLRSGVARHHTGTEADPEIWWRAFLEAQKQAGGFDDVDAVAVGGQQHGLVALDENGSVIRPAILWNDTRSAGAAQDLINELGDGDRQRGSARWAQRTGSVPVASLTVTKIRWMQEHEPEKLRRIAAIALPHDYVSWKLCGAKNIDCLFTDRSEASGTGYFDSVTNQYDQQILRLAAPDLAADVILPKVLQPAQVGGTIPAGQYYGASGAEISVAPGCGDNAGAALGINLSEGHVALSIGTSGVVSTVSKQPINDATGMITGFADATGGYLPIVVTLNASRVIDAYARLIGVSHEEFSRLALSAPPGAEGLVVIPYLSGERTPNLPDATGSLLGVRGDNLYPSNIARATIEGVLCGALAGIDALREAGIRVNEISLIGGGARLEALRRIAPSVLGLDISVPEPGEYVASGAARQAAWMLSRLNEGEEQMPQWIPRMRSTFSGAHLPFISDRYNQLTSMHANVSMISNASSGVGSAGQTGSRPATERQVTAGSKAAPSKAAKASGKRKEKTNPKEKGKQEKAAGPENPGREKRETKPAAKPEAEKPTQTKPEIKQPTSSIGNQTGRRNARES